MSPKWKGPLMNVKSKGPQIPSNAKWKPGIDHSPLWDTQSCHSPPPARRFFPLSLLFRNFIPLYKALRGIIRKPSDQSCYLQMHVVRMGLVRPLLPWAILLIYCYNQLKKYIAPLLRLVSGALSVPLLMSVPFHTLIKFCYTNCSWVIKPGPCFQN